MRILWREAKKKLTAFAHIRIDLTGEQDQARCAHCDVSVSLESPGRTRQSLLLETARKHYYKHKLDVGKLQS